MKKYIFLAMFIMISATSFGQFNHVNTVPQVWNNTPTYSSGGDSKLVLNSGTNRMELTPNTLLSGKVVAGIETDSARSYTHTGAFLTKIKFAVRDTINLTAASYYTNQEFQFVVVASGADTTVFIPNSGNVNGASTYTMTGTNNAITLYFDGANYWILK